MINVTRYKSKGNGSLFRYIAIGLIRRMKARFATKGVVRIQLYISKVVLHPFFSSSAVNVYRIDFYYVVRFYA